jgi:cytochrome c biogenesis protein CcmG/thiol:disulfide interchange protein DsbE
MNVFRTVLFVSVLVLFVSGTAGSAEKEGRAAPDFTLRDLNGKKVSLSDLCGDGPILISLWALWCRPCLEEMPYLDKLYRKYKERGIKVLAVSEDSPRSLNKVKTYIRSKNYQFRVLTDPNGDLTRKFKTKVIPYTVVVDSDGRIVHSRTGYRKGQEKELERILLDVLKSPARDDDDT